jgi:hypothetical protein
MTWLPWVNLTLSLVGLVAVVVLGRENGRLRSRLRNAESLVDVFRHAADFASGRLELEAAASRELRAVLRLRAACPCGRCKPPRPPEVV